jgi:hypothetical protein
MGPITRRGHTKNFLSHFFLPEDGDRTSLEIFADEIYAYNNKHSLRSNTKGYGGKTH